MESKTHLETLKNTCIENSINGIFFANDNFELLYANKKCLGLLEYRNKEQIIGKKIEKLFFTEIGFEKLKKSIRQSGKWQGRVLIQPKRGEKFKISLSLMACSAENSENRFFQGIFKKIEEYSLRELVNRDSAFQNLLESMPDAILIIGEDGIIKICNSQVEHLMGYKKRELIGQHVGKLIPAESLPKQLQNGEESIQLLHERSIANRFESYAERKDGSRFLIDIMLGPLKEDGQLNTIATVRDVSKFQQLRQKLKNEEAFTSLLQKVAASATRAESVEKTLEQSIREICEFMGWPAGHVYLPAEDGSGNFYPADIWYLNDEEKFSSFKDITMNERFVPEKGIVREVIQSGEPEWYKDMHQEPRLDHLISEKDIQIRTCLGVPIVATGQVIGVLEFLISEEIMENKALREKIMIVGKQLGQAIERIKVNEILNESRAKFRTLFYTTPDAILIFNKKELIDCNESAIRLFQRSKKILKNTSVFSFLPEKQPNGQKSKVILQQKIARTFAGEDQFFEMKFERPDGSTFYAEINLIRMQLDKDIYIGAILRDITGRKEDERLLKRDAEQFKQLFSNSSSSIALLDKSEKVLKVNDSFKEKFGYENEEVKNKKITDFFVPEDQRGESRDNIKKTFKGDSVRFEAKRVRKDKTVIPVVIDTVPVVIDGNIEALFKIYIDISKQKHIGEELRKSLDEKEILLREIHDRVKNNLAVVSGLLGLQINHTQDEVAIKKLRESQSRIHSMGLVHDLLYKVDSLSALNLEEYIKKLTDSIKSKFNSGLRDVKVHFKSHYEDSLQLNVNQAIPCGQLLHELLTNAFQHAFKNQKKGVIAISLSEKNNLIELKVADTGSGIPDEVLENRSNSLGLTLVFNLVKQLQGEINITNQGGTTFTITFAKGKPS